MKTQDFDIRALYAALDTQRQSRGLSWAEMTRAITGQSSSQSPRSLSATTIKGILTKSAVEGDGVLQMIRWLDRSPESFVPSVEQGASADVRLPDVLPHEVLRFDTRKIYAALQERRLANKLTWMQVAQEIGVGASSLTYLSKGGRTSFPAVMRIVAWLGKPAAEFTRASAGQQVSSRDRLDTWKILQETASEALV